MTRVHAFLALTHVVNGDALVIEGWISDDELVQALDLAKRGYYRVIVTTGGPLAQGVFLSEHKTYAQLSLASLQKIGTDLPVIAVASPEVRKDRTYASALAVKSWLSEQYTDVHSFDVVTAGPYARRTLLLYRKAFGSDYTVGIIALPVADYDASSWWTSSAGVRTVIGEAIAWVYAAFFFSPSAGK